MSLPAYASKTKNDFSFDDFAGPVKKKWDPATRPAKQINKIIKLRTQNIKTVYTSRL